MRTIYYKRHEFHAMPEDAKAPLWAFLFDIPYLAICGIFPPYQILNEELASGGNDGGMSPGATWPSFVISEAEYEALLPIVLNPNREELKKFARYYTEQWLLDSELNDIETRSDWIKAVGQKHREAYRKRREQQ